MADKLSEQANSSGSGVADEARDQISGSVVSVVFRNDENGYTVCTIKPHGGRSEPFTLVGSCAAIWEGEEISAAGNWINHPQHGKQFQANDITCVKPS